MDTTSLTSESSAGRKVPPAPPRHDRPGAGGTAPPPGALRPAVPCDVGEAHERGVPALVRFDQWAGGTDPDPRRRRHADGSGPKPLGGAAAHIDTVYRHRHAPLPAAGVPLPRIPEPTRTGVA